MSFNEIYTGKRRSAEDAIDCIRGGDRIIVPTGVAEPPTLLAALSTCRRE